MTQKHQDLPQRSLKSGLSRGLRRRCPNCGDGKMFDGYLKVKDNCDQCGEDFTHQRADDGPAWATMLITGHMMPPVILGIYDFYEKPNPILVAVILVTIFSLITLYLLPRIKGGFVAIQWVNYMYGFNPNFQDKKKPAIPSET